MHRSLQTLAIASAGILLTLSAQASPSGLNNIPTTDTAPDLTPVLQVYSLWGAERKPDHSAGMKIGLGPWDGAALGSRFEAGVDAHYAPDPAGPVTFQVKYALEPWEKGPALAIGSANLAPTSDYRDRSGQPFSYLMLSHRVKDWFRLHGGYGIQHNGNSALLGIERDFEVFGKPLTLRSDAVQIQNQHDWMASVGILYPLTGWAVLDSWANFPVDDGKPSFMLKLNFVLDWKTWTGSTHSK